MTVCPNCNSEQVIKNGLIYVLDKTAPAGPVRNGKQNHRCRACGRQFVLNPTKKVISDETKRRSDRLLVEKIPLARIARVMEVSESWLQGYVNQRYACAVG